MTRWPRHRLRPVSLLLSEHDIRGAGGEAANIVLAQVFAFFPADFRAKERLLAVVTNVASQGKILNKKEPFEEQMK